MAPIGQEIHWPSAGLYDFGDICLPSIRPGTQLLRFNGGDGCFELGGYSVQFRYLHCLGWVENIRITFWVGVENQGVVRKKPDSPKWSLANGLPSAETPVRPLSGWALFLDNGFQVQTSSPDQGITLAAKF